MLLLSISTVTSSVHNRERTVVKTLLCIKVARVTHTLRKEFSHTNHAKKASFIKPKMIGTASLPPKIVTATPIKS